MRKKREVQGFGQNNNINVMRLVFQFDDGMERVVES
jgi:hypothetical protein